MKTVEAMIDMGGIEDARGDLDADVVSGEHFATGCAALLGDRENCGEHWSRYMHALIAARFGLQRIVVIVGVHRDAIY